MFNIYQQNLFLNKKVCFMLPEKTRMTFHKSNSCHFKNCLMLWS